MLPGRERLKVPSDCSPVGPICTNFPSMVRKPLKYEVILARASCRPGWQTALFDPLVVFDQNLALSGVVGPADDAFLLHALDDRGSAVVADLQAPLDVAGRGLAVAKNDGNRLIVEVRRLLVAHRH